MTIFAILMPKPQANLVDAIQKIYPSDHLSISDTQWLISSPDAIIEVTAKLGIYDTKNPNAPINNLGVVFAISSYSGRAPTVVWDWIKSKLESSTNG